MSSVGSRKRRPVVRAASPQQNAAYARAMNRQTPPPPKQARTRPFQHIECDWISPREHPTRPGDRCAPRPSTPPGEQPANALTSSVEDAMERGKFRAELGLSPETDACGEDIKADAPELDTAAAMRRGQFKAELGTGPQLGHGPTTAVDSSSPCPPRKPVGGSAHEVTSLPPWYSHRASTAVHVLKLRARQPYS